MKRRLIEREDIVAILGAIENRRTIDDDAAERIYPILVETVTGDELIVVDTLDLEARY